MQAIFGAGVGFALVEGVADDDVPGSVHAVMSSDIRNAIHNKREDVLYDAFLYILYLL